MTPKYFSTFSHKRGRPKGDITHPIYTLSRQPTEYIDQLFQRGDITMEHRLASILYRTLYYQVYSPIGRPTLSRSTLKSLSKRFKPYRSFFTPEEKENWYQERSKMWNQLRQELENECRVCLNFLDDVLIYKETDFQYATIRLTPAQLTMLDRALLHMVHFFGLNEP